MRGISTDRWSCPNCPTTISRTPRTSAAGWIRIRNAMQARHGQFHSGRAVDVTAELSAPTGMLNR